MTPVIFPLIAVIGALHSLVLDVFFIRSSTSSNVDATGLDEEREVLSSLLLRHIQHYRIADLFSLVLLHAVNDPSRCVSIFIGRCNE